MCVCLCVCVCVCVHAFLKDLKAGSFKCKCLHICCVLRTSVLVHKWPSHVIILWGPNSIYKVSSPRPKHVPKGSNCPPHCPRIKSPAGDWEKQPLLLGFICAELGELEWLLTPVSLTLTESTQLTHLQTDGNHSFAKLIACRFNIETSFFNLPLRKRDRKQGV